MCVTSTATITASADASRSQSLQHSQCSLVRQWIDALPAPAFFKLSDIPHVSSNIAAKTMSELVTSRKDLRREAHGCYVKTGTNIVVLPAHAALRYAGSGAGFAGQTALCEVGWGWQSPVLDQIAVVGRAPRISWDGCRFMSRSNSARKSLNWVEVTLIEALRSGRFGDLPWVDVLDMVRRAGAHPSMSASLSVRPDMVLAVGMQEGGQKNEFYQRLQELVGVLKERQHVMISE